MGCVSWKLEFPFRGAPQLNTDWPPVWPELLLALFFFPPQLFCVSTGKLTAVAKTYFSGATPPTSLLWQSRGMALLSWQHRQRSAFQSSRTLLSVSTRLVFLHFPESSLSPIPTWKMLKNYQTCLCAYFLELLHVLPVKVTSKGTASILVFQK